LVFYTTSIAQYNIPISIRSIDGRGSSEGEKLVNGNLLSFSFDSTTLRSANLNFTG
jgi:hypothetical protein